MRWILRHAVFVLCFSLGSTAWYLLAQQGSVPGRPVQAAKVTPNSQTIVLTDSEQQQEKVMPGQLIKFGPVEPITGYANIKTLTLRESADINAPVVAKLKPGDGETLEILDATGDFLYVRIPANDGSVYGAAERKQEYQGWTTWASVVTDMSAIVLDAESGAVVSRVPLGDGHTSVIFSPDGKRAIFSGEGSGINRTAYEVQTSDYTLTRSLISPENEPFSALFYAPTSGDLYAKLYTSSPSLVRVSEGGAPNTPVSIAPNIIISRDGQLGLIVRRDEGDDPFVLTVDVMELATLEVRNTFKVTGANLASDGSGFVLSRDGSELYLRPSDNTGAVSVIDTRTGQVLPELPESATQSWSYFWHDSVVGDSLLLRVWGEEGDEQNETPTKYWVSNGRRTLAETGVDHAIEVGGKRYAVNEEGTLFFRLGDNNRIQKSFSISRPEQRADAGMGNGLSVFGLSASPNGKHIIMFVGISHSCAH